MRRDIIRAQRDLELEHLAQAEEGYHASRLSNVVNSNVILGYSRRAQVRLCRDFDVAFPSVAVKIMP